MTNLLTQICGLSILILLYVFIGTRKKLGLYRERVFMWVMHMTFITVLLDILSVLLIMNLNSAENWQWLVIFVAKLYVASLTWDGWMAYMYMLLDSMPEEKHRKHIGVSALCNLPITAATMILPLWTHYDENELYTEGWSAIVVYASAAIYSTLIIASAIKRKKNMSPRKIFAMITWVVFLVGAALIQFFFKDVLIITFAMSLGVLILFVAIENPEANTDRHLGCFNSYAKTILISSLWEEKKKFSILKIWVSPLSFTGKNEDEKLVFLREIINILGDDKDLYIFKGNDLSFNIVSENGQKLKATAEKLLKTETTASSGTYCVYFEDPYILEKSFDIDRMFDFVIESEMAKPRMLNYIDVQTVRLFKIRNLVQESRGEIPEEMKNEYEYIKSREKRKKSLEIVDVLSSEYSAVYYVNTETGKITPYDLRNDKNGLLKDDYSADMNYLEAYEKFGAGFIYSEDKALYIKSCSLYTVLDKLSQSRRYSIIVRLDLNGRLKYYEIRFVRVEEENEKLLNFVIGFADKDQEVRERLAQEQSIRDALAAAEKANQAKTNFLFSMSHDIRTPLNAIIGFSKMAKKNIGDTEKTNECMDKIIGSGNVLLNVINDILDMSRIESGEVEIIKSPVDIRSVFDDIRPMLSQLAAEKNLDIDYTFEDIDEPYLNCDISHIKRVLINIISNAIKYTNSGGYAKVKCSQAVRDMSNTDKAYTVFTVEDNGIGISEEFQTKIFERFTREETSTNSGIQGSGLGLSLCKSLVDLMGGNILCESKKGVGSKFTVILPLEIAKETVELKKEENCPVKALHGKRLLLTDDNELNREIAKDVLLDMGFLVEEAQNGSECVEKVRQNPPDYYACILMDIQMPVMNGYEATNEIRRLPLKSRIPIIALSANAFDEDKKKSLSAGMNGHVAKPIDRAELEKTLEKVIIE